MVPPSGVAKAELAVIAIVAMTSDNFLYLFIIVFVKILTSFKGAIVKINFWNLNVKVQGNITTAMLNSHILN